VSEAYRLLHGYCEIISLWENFLRMTVALTYFRIVTLFRDDYQGT